MDTAQRLVQRVQPPPDEARFDAAVSEAIAECLAKGLTGIHEMGADLRALAAYRRLVERGRFPFRNYVAVAGRDEAAWCARCAHVCSRSPASQPGCENHW